MTLDQTCLETIPKKSGVYLMKNEMGKVLYIGKAKVLKTRVKQYFTPGQDSRAMIPILMRQTAQIDTIITFTEKEALLLENTLIKKHKPKYNVLLKDDKTHLSILINHYHKWPMIKLIRTKENSKEKGLLFGPYTSALSARKTFEIISKVFPLRQCSDRELASRKRPCILHSIGRCIAPCVQKCTKEEYDEVVTMAKDFLKGKSKEVVKQLKHDLKLASERLEYEKAGVLLKTIQQVEETLQEKKSAVQFNAKDCDAFNYIKKDNYILIVKLSFREGRLMGSEHFDFNYILGSDEETLTSFLLQHYEKSNRPKEIQLPIKLNNREIIEELLSVKIFIPMRGEKRTLIDLALENAKVLFEQEQTNHVSSEELLLELQEKLQLSKFPTRIECFDTSCSSGKEFVASLVTFTNGVKDTKGYRLYKIKSDDVKDDTAAMYEVLKRRLTRARKEDDLPDLIIVDGGKGQLTQLIRVINDLDIASVELAALAKESSRHDQGLTKEKVYRPNIKEAIEFSRHSSLLFFLQRIRDEAHRRAIDFHRKRRSTKSTQSILDQVTGIGIIKKKALLKHFGSVKNIANAKIEEIVSLPGFSEKDAKELLSHLKINQ